MVFAFRASSVIRAGLLLGLTWLTSRAVAQDCPLLLQHTFPRLQDETPQNLCQYRGKVLLVVNTASYCGFTPQYEGLEKLHEKVRRTRARDPWLSVLRLWEPGEGEQSGDRGVCFNTYGVKFPMFAKDEVSSVRKPIHLFASARAVERLAAEMELPQVSGRS
jgi:glutathione peroxidase